MEVVGWMESVWADDRYADKRRSRRVFNFKVFTRRKVKCKETRTRKLSRAENIPSPIVGLDTLRMIWIGLATCNLRAQLEMEEIQLIFMTVRVVGGRSTGLKNLHNFVYTF